MGVIITATVWLVIRLETIKRDQVLMKRDIDDLFKAFGLIKRNKQGRYESETKFFTRMPDRSDPPSDHGGAD